MLSILRFIFRFIVFLVALAAIVVIVGAGVWYFQTQGRGGTTIALSEVPGNRRPEGAEDWLLSMYLQSRADEINKPVSDDPTSLNFVVESGEAVPSVATRLQEMGLI